ncbi:hypothetical protein [Paenibacillus sp. Soil522]|uniref:hypothetical protein n=1 Tax=Paenibacillus sp. Soil522 TaxID=1736388 RepID=UPI0006FBC9A6|nr:hypothetical protein [Paenibacillus sp. Soil522]KRE46323.1 hypothetical protein ASG81_12025 [Paenibacillus sp. Soil522]
MIGNKLIYLCGYNGGIYFSFATNPRDRKVKKYIRGFKNDGYYLDLNEKIYRWNRIPKFPGAGRQAGRTVCIDNTMYCYGGYVYAPTRIYSKLTNNKKKQSFRTLQDGYALKYTDNKWIWTKLSDLPVSMTGFGMTKINNYIYICCGAHRKAHYRCHHLMVKVKSRNNKNTEIGRILYRLDINNLDKGWEKYDTFPGTLRFNPAMTSIGDKIYIIGGVYPNQSWITNIKDISERFYNINDNNGWLPMNVIIRADASIAIGTGHVYRCVALASKLSVMGANTSFICRESPGHLCEWIERHGFPVYRIPANEDDALCSKAILQGLEKPADCLIVDHYTLDASWEKAQRPYVKNSSDRRSCESGA